jgi:uncharacterized protein (DUF58 family)
MGTAVGAPKTDSRGASDVPAGSARSRWSFSWFRWWPWRNAAEPAGELAQDEPSRPGLTPELIRRIRGIHLRTSHLVDDLMAGEYVSAFKGRGMEFEEVREYQPGDDIRTIDWNVTARMGHPFVKTFREERELTVMLLVDVSSSGQFGTHTRTKNEVAAELAAILAYAAIRNHDKVGLLLFTDQVERYIPPKKGRGHVWRVIREVLEHRPVHRRTDLGAALGFLNKVTHRRSVCFVISDFMDEGYQRPLRLTSRAHDVIAISIADPREQALPPVGFIELEDAETGEIVLVDTSDPVFNRAFRGNSERRARERDDAFRSMKVDHIPVRADQDTISPLLKYFRLRERRQ